MLSSCRITRKIPDNEYLLDDANVVIKSDEKKVGVSESELRRYVRQEPNKRVLLFRFHLRLFNMAREGRDKGFSKLFRTIGEEPVLLDTFQTQQSTASLKRYMESKGFYHATVSDTTKLGRKKATVNYIVKPGKPYRINRIDYIIEDSLIQDIVLKDTVNSVLKKGSRFDTDVLREERKRIESSLKEEGYYFFSRDFITFSADTNIANNKVDLELVIRNRFTRSEFGERIPQKYRKYEISNVYIFTKYDPVEFYHLRDAGLLDTTFVDNQHFIYSYSPGIKYKTISSANLIRPGDLYSQTLVKKSRNNLNSLRLYRAVNVFFRPDKDAEDSLVTDDNFMMFDRGEEEKERSKGKLNCYIQLTPHTLQSYQVDLVGTNTASDIGMEGNLNYQHKNIFKGAEIFDTRFRGMVQFISTDNGFDNSFEVGGSAGFSFPRFLSPFSSQEYITRYSPRTQTTASYSYQDRPDYTRTIAGMNLSYSWQSENQYVHTFTPLEINLINIFQISDDFLNQISGTYLENSYRNALVTISSYSLVFSNQSSSKKNYSVLRYNFELSGNILSGIYSALDLEKVDGAYQLFNTNFSQFVRSDINYVYNQHVDDKNTFVYRLYAGAGLPYGNSKALPFEKKYFSGGSTGIRAWNARELGPGTYVMESGQTRVPNQTADIKFEANVEYRFNLVWMLEGALFIDAGNIWAISSADERPGAVFNPNSFYRQIALGTGTGIRMNMGFFTIRFDLGVKVHDPGIAINSEEPNYHWIPFDRSYQKGDFVFHFGIGYPF
ncbi:MAG: BamA/TamA family outer membrane protein [Bacteroidales bacterium]